MNTKHAVVFVSDDKYIIQFLVTLQSLIKESKDVSFDAYLITCGLNAYNISKIETWSREHSFNINILYIDIKELDWLKVMETYWSRFMFLKLYIPYLIPKHISYILYLDVDLLIVNNIKPLLQIDVSQYAVAGVEDTPDCIQHKKRCNIPSSSPYINSGVMLINLIEWRTAASQNLFWEYIQKNIYERKTVNDQDVINYIFQNKILTIHLKFNITNHCFGIRPNILPYHKKQLKECYRNPIVIHFTNWNKPWIKGNFHLYKKRWLKEEKEVCKICNMPSLNLPSNRKGKKLINAIKYLITRIYNYIKYQVI